MLGQTTATATATFDNSTRVPDFFSCRECQGYDSSQTKRPSHPLATEHGWVDMCTILQEEGRCRLDMLKQALETGAVQVHIVIAPAQLPMPIPQPALAA